MSRKIFILILSLFIINIAHANWPPSSDGYVYRFDTRPPTTNSGYTGIFSTGFMPHGQNVNLLEHISGSSAVGRTSAWVSTTETLQLAEEFATSFLTFNPQLQPPNSGIAGYIYRILPSDNFYSINFILDNVENREPYYDTAVMDQVRNLRQVFGMQHEWAALNGIPRTQVREAIPVYWTSGRAIAMPNSGESNPYYIHFSRVPSDSYYSLSEGRGAYPVLVAAIPTNDTLIDLSVLTADDWREMGVTVNNTEDLSLEELNFLNSGALSLSFDPFPPDCMKRADSCSSKSKHLELDNEKFYLLRKKYLTKLFTMVCILNFFLW